MIGFRKEHSLIALIFCFAWAMWPSHSNAHRMLVDHVVENGTVSVDVFFPDGKPARNVKVEVYRADETLYLSGETDEAGRFNFNPGDENFYKVVAIGKLGHKAEQEVSLSTAEKPEGIIPTEDEVRKRDPIPFREIFAGFGYILGVAGILIYLKARSDLRKAKGGEHRAEGEEQEARS